MIARHGVESAMIKSVGHDPDTNELHFEFHNGKVYAHPGTADDLRAALEAPSLGKHYNAVYKGKRPHRLV